MGGIAWPAVAHPAGASMMAMQFQLERSQWWPREKLLEHQFRQMRALAAHAIKNVAFYRDHLGRAGLDDPARLTSETFLRWPLLTRAQLQENPEALTAASYPAEHGTASEHFTSGSTGTPVRVRNSQVVQFFDHALVLRDHLWHERDFSAKLAAIRLFTKEGRQPGWSPITNAVFRTGAAALMDISSDVAAQLEWLVWERPVYLLTTPSNLAALLLVSGETGRKPAGLREVLTYAESLPEGLREELAQAWGAKLVDAYSAREVGAIALQCPEATHYHVQGENLYVEVLREDGRPCAPGETGRIVITALHSFSMPLLRYDIGDYAEVGAPCACGRGLAVLKRIAGRVTSMAVDPTGRRFWPGIRPSLLLKAAPLRQLRLIQHTEREIEMEYVMERELTAEERKALGPKLTELLGYPFEFRFTRVEAMARAPGEKFRDFVSKLARS